MEGSISTSVYSHLVNGKGHGLYEELRKGISVFHVLFDYGMDLISSIFGLELWSDYIRDAVHLRSYSRLIKPY